MELHTNSFLQGGKYKIEKVLGQGGFGITYLGTQVALNRKVAIKEFFMKEYCERNSNTSHVSLGTSGSREIVERFRTKFIKEAQTIAEMDNNHIIRIYDVFEENGTAYYVMEYLPGGDLSKRIPNNGLPETEALGYIRQIGDALTYIHSKNILHLDIKPTNILFRRDGEVVLIDFGVSKHYDDTSGSQTSSTPVGISEGYAPTEQYDREAIASFAPSTDVYSLGATLYCLLCGTRPPKASVVLNEGLPALPSKVSESTRKAVEKAMSPRRKDRPQSVKEFINLLHETTSYDTEDELTHLSEESKKDLKSPVIKHATKKNWVGYLLYSILSLLCIVGIICWGNRDKTDENEIPLTENASNINSEVDTISTASISESQTVQTEESVTISQPSGQINSHDYVDLGLSVKWAMCNVGANKPEEYGDFFGWGNISAMSELSNQSGCHEMSDISGKELYDVARHSWKENWRLPTNTEFNELISKCNWIWSSINEHKGYKIIGPNGNSIFLPAAGERDNIWIREREARGNYWSSTPENSNGKIAFHLAFSNEGYYLGCNPRKKGKSIRPVSK